MQPVIEACLAVVDVACGLAHALGGSVELALHVDETMPGAGAAALLLRSCKERTRGDLRDIACSKRTLRLKGS